MKAIATDARAHPIFVALSKRKRISQKRIDEYLQLLRALPIRVEARTLWENVALESLARKWNLAAYDAAYLDLALRKNLPLATVDAGLKKAAEAAGVPVVL